MSSTNLDLLPDKPVKPVKGGRLQPKEDFRQRLRGKRFIVTVAQNNTKVFDDFWKTLVRMSTSRKAKLLVAQTTYNKNGWQRITRESETLDGTTDSEGLWWDAKLAKYFITDQVKLAEDLVFCAELDILPTMVYPLNGLDNYTGPNSAIVPHTKMQMRSLATLTKFPKLLYTTGAVTLRNYIQRRAGQIAEFHHVYGALWVEVDNDGDWFVRQLNADDNGIVYDLDRVWGPTWDKPIAEFGRPYVNLGDIHAEKADELQIAGADDLISTLNPEKVFIHDLLDMKSRNHHNIRNPHFLAAQKQDTVQLDVRKAAMFVRNRLTKHPLTEFYLIRSNHDQALARWVRDGSGFTDPINARYWHELNLYAYSCIEGGYSPDIFKYAVQQQLSAIQTRSEDFMRLKWIQEDQSLVYRGIEFGMHGHLGPDGARGNPKSFRQSGRRANTGHTHSAGIIDGIWTAGILGSLNQEYNVGLSSWSCSHIITHPNGKRQIVTQRGKKWRAL